MAATEGLLKPGDVLHETYRIEALVGVGGTGEVYRASNMVSRRTVAIKILKKQYSANERFIDLMRRELLRDIDSKAVVKYFELLRTQMYGGLHFLVMEMIEGPSLARLMHEKGPLPPSLLLTVAKRAAAGLSAAHAEKVFHRDIAPDNILLRGGAPEGATLIDFGIAKDLNPDARTVVGAGFAGKYEYAAPEQMDGRADGQSDIYALGVTLLAAARGRAPEIPDDLMAIRRMKDQPLDLSGLPPAFAELVARMTAPDKARRIASAPELERALAEIGEISDEPEPLRPARAPSLGGLRTASTPPPSTPSSLAPRTATGGEARPRRRGPWLWIAAGAAAAALAAFAVLGPFRDRILGPGVPMIESYALTASLSGGAASIEGHAPTAEAREALLAAARAGDADGRIEGDIAIARGEPNPDWAAGLAEMIAGLGGLDAWRLEAGETRARLSGEAPDQRAADRARRAALEAAAVAGVVLDAALTAPEPPPDPAWLAQQAEELMGAYRCGELAMVGGADAVLGDGPVRVSGAVADDEALGKLRDGLRRVFPDREIALDVTARNAFVCRMARILPSRSAADIRIALSEGATGEPAPTGLFPPDGNPIVDVSLPADLDGLLHVFIVGNEGGVASLIPHADRRDARLSGLGRVEGDRRIVRASYTQAESAAERRAIGFTPPFGDYLVAAVVADDELYDPSRPLLENLEEIAPRLAGSFAVLERRGDPVAFDWKMIRVAEAER